ncbi:MAG: DUF2760 domain-containing protein [Planctomycetales bacterium]|nr:DUF2760 domain-containing protein [Planctomycetales bacterium]
MNRIFLAFRIFFGTLFGSAPAQQVALLLEGPTEEAKPPQPASENVKPSAPSPAAKKPRRSEALTLLAALQREARLVDLIQEPLSDYSDEQIGAAARDVLRDCHKVLDRLFALQPATEANEGARLETPASFDAAEYKVSGNVSGEPPYHGQVIHPGWKATKCDMPQWQGSADAAWMVAPIEIEIT